MSRNARADRHVAPDMTTIGIIGSGSIGSNVARAAVAKGYEVVLSNSRGPDSLEGLIHELGPKARAGFVEDAVEAGDLVLIAIPLKAVTDLPVEPFEDKIIIDANNYYPERDGRIEALDSNQSTTSELVQAHFPYSHVVKAFNSIFAKQIVTDGLPADDPQRRALPIAGNAAGAKDQVAHFLDDLGYDVLDLGDLSESWRVERDTPSYGKYVTLDELVELTGDIERVQQT